MNIYMVVYNYCTVLIGNRIKRAATIPTRYLLHQGDERSLPVQNQTPDNFCLEFRRHRIGESET